MRYVLQPTTLHAVLTHLCISDELPKCILSANANSNGES